MIERLSTGASGSTSAPGSTSSISSSINGRGKSVAVAAAQVNVGNALSTAATSFRNSFIRMDDALQKFGKTQSYLQDLSDSLDELTTLAERSLDPEASDEERARLNSTFQKKITEYRALLRNSTQFDTASEESTDFLSTTDLEQVLRDAGVDPSSATALAETFARLGNGDTDLGISPIISDDVTVGNDDGTTSTAIASTGSDPLTQDISTRAQAAIAVNTLAKLQDDVKTDLKNVSFVISELKGAQSFALAGYAASASIAGQLSQDDANKTAIKLVSLIRKNDNDISLAAHSDIDATLAKELLGSSTSTTTPTLPTSIA